MANNQLPTELSLIEPLSRVFAIALGLLYLVGFMVVASYLSRYGVSSFAVLQLQYLIAGIWVLGPPVLMASLHMVERRFSERAAPEPKEKFNWRRFAVSSSISGIPASVFFSLLAIIPGVSDNLTWGIGIRFFLFYMGMRICADAFWTSYRVPSTKETWGINRSYAAPFYLSSLLLIVFCYALWFSVRIYPLIPFSMGGGKPLTVTFFEGEKKMPEEIQKAAPSAKTSVPYKLLLATDKYFVVVSPSDKERSVEISRDSVAGMVVLAAN
jgi:hypothetical protein